MRWLGDVVARLPIRADRAPIDTADRVFYFVSTRASLISQKKLYGYLKERIGIRYPTAFEDPTFARSIDLAKMQVFAASLSDLTIHAVAQIELAKILAPAQRDALARACYDSGLADNAEGLPDPLAPAAWRSAFEKRVREANWRNLEAGATAFVESPKALVRWAPISEEYKRYDREIVENSIRFAWNEVIADLRARLDARAVAESWRGGNDA
jgi:hypothetical protein